MFPQGRGASARAQTRMTTTNTARLPARDALTPRLFVPGWWLVRDFCPLSRNIFTFPEFRKRGSHPYELRWVRRIFGRVNRCEWLLSGAEIHGAQTRNRQVEGDLLSASSEMSKPNRRGRSANLALRLIPSSLCSSLFDHPQPFVPKDLRSRAITTTNRFAQRAGI